MALENYSRGQKLFMAVFITLLAGTFTVSAAMITVFEGGGSSAPTDQGIINGREIRLMHFQQKRRGLHIVRSLDNSIRPFSDKPPEPIYARVPAMMPQQEFGHDWPFTATQPRLTSLLDLWPAYQDQYVWCHMVLAERARNAGVQPPSHAYIGNVITEILNASRDELTTIRPGQLRQKFRETFNVDLEEVVPTISEALMIRDYVESLLADEKARLDQIATIDAGNRIEKKAEYVRLSIEPFMEQAMQDVRDEHFNWRAARIAGGFGVASKSLGYDRYEEAYDKNRATQLRSDARFRLDIIRAFPDDMVRAAAVPFDEDMARLVYLAVRDEVYPARAQDKERIEDRLEDARNRLSIDETEEWSPEQWSEWEAKTRAEMQKYRLFDEVRGEVERSLQRREALNAAQMGITSLLSYLNQNRRERERRLRAELEVVRKEKAVWDQRKNYLEGLRRRFDGIETQTHAKMRDIGNRYGTQVDELELELRRPAHERLMTDAARELGNLDREAIETLIAEATLAAQNLERSLNDLRAQREEFVLREDKRTDDGQTMTEEEVEARLRRYDFEIEAVQARITLRDEKLPEVQKFADALRGMYARYELLLRNLDHTEPGELSQMTRELLVEIPVQIGVFVREQRDLIAPQSELDGYANRADIIQSDLTARENSLRKDAADTRGLNFAAIVDRENNRLGIQMVIDTVAGEQTWESLVTSENYDWIENVNGAKQFLEDAQNAAGAVSGVLTLPGSGYLLLRLTEKTASHAQGRLDADNRVTRIAAQRRARELAVDELRRIRADIIKRGWDTAVSDARSRHERHFSVHTTPWFREGVDIPGLYSYNDTDVLNVATAPSTMQPEQPFIGRIRDIKPREGVSALIPERSNRDPLRRPDHDRWSYLLARVVDTRTVPHRMSDDAMRDQGMGWGAPPPAELWRNRHLAASELVRGLIEPARLLSEHQITLFIQDDRRSKDDDKKKDDEKDSEKAKS